MSDGSSTGTSGSLCTPQPGFGPEDTFSSSPVCYRDQTLGVVSRKYFWNSKELRGAVSMEPVWGGRLLCSLCFDLHMKVMCPVISVFLIYLIISLRTFNAEHSCTYSVQIVSDIAVFGRRRLGALMLLSCFWHRASWLAGL